MNVVDLLLRWMHIYAGVMLAGGLVFLACVWAPANAGDDAEVVEERYGTFRKLWARIVMLSTLLLLVSGIVNLVLTVKKYDVPGYYHMIFGIKFLLAFVVFWLAAKLSGRSDSAINMRKRWGHWVNIAMLLALVVVGMGSMLKVIEHTPKAISPTTSVDPGNPDPIASETN